MRHHKTKGCRLLTLAALLLLATAAGTFFFRDRLFAADTSRLLTSAVARGNIENTVLASGTFRPAKLVAVGAQVSGRITSLKVKLGDRVQKGALVAEIDSVTQQNELRTAQAALANIRAQRLESDATLENAQRTLARQQNIASKQAGSQADLDTAEATYKKTLAEITALDAQIISAQVAVETAQANLAYTHITAPMDGTVLAIVNQEGQTVNAAQTAPTIVILGQLDTMTVRAEISEADVVRVQPGQKVNFTILGDPDDQHSATLQSIEPAPATITSDSAVSTSSTSTTTTSSSTSSSSAIYYYGNFDVPNADGRFRTYMSAVVHIVLGSVENVLTIPSAALGARQGDGSYIVQVQAAGGSVSNRTVKVGLNNSVSVEVQSGLSEGERVVIGEASTTKTTTKMGGPPPMGF